MNTMCGFSRKPVAGLFVVLLFAAGCGREHGRYVSQLELSRQGWDTLRVEGRIGKHTRLHGWQPLEPEAVTVQVFSAAYDTLYVGPGPLVPLPDERLGDQEKVMVELCFTLSGDVLCEQEAVTASPKRVLVEHEIVYPEGSNYEQGRYDFQFVVERQQFGQDGWEQIDAAGRVSGYLLAFVEDVEAKAIRVPLEGRKGKFDLTRHENSRDFQYYLRSKLLDQREASVHFVVYAGLNGRADRLASLEKQVRMKTQQERRAEVEFFIEQATEQLIERLHAFDRARVYVNRWHYDAYKQTYVVDLEIWGRSGFFRRFELEGLLEVREDGTAAHFRFRDGNRRADDQWEHHVGGDVLQLDTLKTLPALEEQAAETPPELTSTW